MLDITAFLNALRDGTVSFASSLGARPFVDDSGAVVCTRGENALIVPLGGDHDRYPRYAARLPLESDGGSGWPARYADIGSAAGTITEHLPTGVTILDIEDVAGIDIALLYDWIPGETLTARVTRSRERHTRDRLTELLWPLADIADGLRVSGLVHGDLAPGNLIVRPDGGMTLIDLDRMGYRDADPPVEPRRRPGYRLPRGGDDPEAEDAFSLLVLLVSVAIIADASVPIDHERAPEWTHPNLLFSSWDLMDPQRSRLVREVEPQLSVTTRELLDVLIAASNGRPDRVPAALRDAVRLVRRTGTRPEPGGATSFDADWRLAARPGGSGADPPTRIPPADVWPAMEPREQTGTWRTEWPASTDGRAGWPATAPDHDDGGTGWPEPAPSTRGTSPAGATRGSGRSIEEIMDDLRSITVAPQQPTASPRQQRSARRRARIDERLRQALAENDRTVLVELAMSGELAELGESDRQDVLHVLRALSHEQITRAISADDDGAILAAIDETVFADEDDLDPAFRDRVRLARRREAWSDRAIVAARERDGAACAALLADAPGDAADRLPDAVGRQMRRLADEYAATERANRAIRQQDANTLAQSLGTLASLRPVWTDHVDADAVVALLSLEQIEQRLIGRLESAKLADTDQWMVDLVIAAGRLPEVTRLAGLAPRDVDRMIHREVPDS